MLSLEDGVTGFYGPVTTNAVKKWQHKHGLPASGGWGYQSREMYLRVKGVERRKVLASPEPPVKPAFGFEDGTSGLPAPPPAVGQGSSNRIQTRSNTATFHSIFRFCVFWFSLRRLVRSSFRSRPISCKRQRGVTEGITAFRYLLPVMS